MVVNLYTPRCFSGCVCMYVCASCIYNFHHPTMDIAQIPISECLPKVFVTGWVDGVGKSDCSRVFRVRAVGNGSD